MSDDAQEISIQERADRLREAVKGAGGPGTISKLTGMPAPTLNNYLAGRDMKASAMVTLAEACGVSLSWLATGAGAMRGSGENLPAWAASFGDTLNQPGNFYILCLLLSSCQEYYTRLGVKPSLAEILEWVAQPYTKGFKMPDQPIVLGAAPNP